MPGLLVTRFAVTDIYVHLWASLTWGGDWVCSWGLDTFTNNLSTFLIFYWKLICPKSKAVSTGVGAQKISEAMKGLDMSLFCTEAVSVVSHVGVMLATWCFSSGFYVSVAILFKGNYLCVFGIVCYGHICFLVLNIIYVKWKTFKVKRYS